MRTTLVAALIGAAAVCVAHDVGVFANDRILSYVYNMETGSYMSTVRGYWNARGVTWRQTSGLTPGFLDTVDVLYLTHFKGPSLTTEEQTALLNWVRNGGTLIFFGDCG